MPLIAPRGPLVLKAPTIAHISNVYASSKPSERAFFKRIEPDFSKHIRSEIDLHGLRRDAARTALSTFIRDCQRQGLRCVRIVTEKGLGSPGRVPVLKHKVYGWLLQKQNVLAFVQARAAEGGAGAVIVLLAGDKQKT